MKHFYTLFILFTVLSLFCHPATTLAQQGGSDDQIKDRIRAAEIAYLSQKLDLSPEEAQKFWPLYNKYTKEVEILIAERRQHNTSPKTSSQPADQKELGYERRMLDIKTHYSQEFQKVLPAAKAGNVFKSEREFRNQLIRAMKDRQSRNVNGPGARRFRN
jgi:hypothetical protein